jgi:hypothetical protein
MNYFINVIITNLVIYVIMRIMFITIVYVILVLAGHHVGIP